MLKKIDFDSDKYNQFKNIVSFASGVGAGLTLECVTIPFVKAVMKNRLVRLACYGGIAALSVDTMLFAESTVEEIVDSFAFLYNSAIDVKDEETHEDDVQESWHDIRTDDTDNASVIDAIAKHDLYHFSNEDEAKAAVELLTKTVLQGDGSYVSVDAFCDIRDMIKKNFTPTVIKGGSMYGWTGLMEKEIGIEKQSDGSYVVDMPAIEFIGDKIYNTLHNIKEN